MDLVEFILFKLLVFFWCFIGKGFNIILEECLWILCLFFELDGDVCGDLWWDCFIFFEFNVVKWGFVLIMFDCGDDGGWGISFVVWEFFFFDFIKVLWWFLEVMFEDNLILFFGGCVCFCWRSLVGLLKDCFIDGVWRLWLENE